MSFKEEYTELQNSITPDAGFLEQLARKMERQAQTQARSSEKISPHSDERVNGRKKPIAFFISAAVIFTGAAAAMIVVLNLPKPQPSPVRVIGNSDRLSYTVGLFAEKEVFSENAPIPEQLAEMLSEHDTVLYKSDENKFDFDDKLNDTQRSELSNKIKNASETDAELPQKAEYYMAVIPSGDVVKFRISGDILAVKEKFYKIP